METGRKERVVHFPLSPCLLIFLFPATTWADGGTLCFSKQCGSYRITLFTAPTSLRAGPVDFSVLVQAADSGKPLLDVHVAIQVYPKGEPQRQVGGVATTATATNKLFQSIQLELAEPGQWHVEVVVQSPEEAERVETELDVGPPLPSWIDLSLWIGWPAAAIVLFVIHQCLVRRRRRHLQRDTPHERREATT